MSEKLRYWIIALLWKLPGVSRRYCWAEAVTWAIGATELWKRADHECFYCLACNTQAEIDEYHRQAAIERERAEDDVEARE